VGAWIDEVERRGSTVRRARHSRAIGRSSETPDAVSDAAKGDANKLRDYWTAGASPVLEQEGRASLPQLTGMLCALFAADHEDRRAPDGWKDLKRIGVAEASGRAHCHGLGCLETRVFADQG
jgi:hypothetical protein